ncbi:MAG TPA: SH3 domain-containing protein, partial [Thiothrix sp.]|nr:SH3 domain-containing protein [Thiothrix sp.]
MQGKSKKSALFVLYKVRDEILKGLMLLIAVSLTLLCVSPAAIAAVTHEVNASWLNVRSSAALSAKKVGKLKRASQVEVVKRVGSKKTIQGKRGYWVKIKAKQASRTVSGYVFDAYLRKLSANDSSSSSSSRENNKKDNAQPTQRNDDNNQSASQSHKKTVKQLIKQYPTHAKKRVLLVDVSEQRLYVFNRKAKLLKSYQVST